MKILIAGGNGFIGSHCAAALVAAGHEVICGGRRPGPWARLQPSRHMTIDFMQDFDAALWRRRLFGIDVVINTVGAMAELKGQNLEALHFTAPRALFDACAELDIEVIQISALGADAAASSRFHLTKKAADDYLLANHRKAVVLQPSLVYGTGGASARMFDMLASLPLIPLVGDGGQLLQPVHIDDVTSLVTKIVSSRCCYGRRIAVVGPAPLELREYLAQLRSAMRLGPAHFVHLSTAFVAVVVRLAARLRIPWASPESLRMLQRGNTADAGGMTALLGRTPRAARDFIPPDLAHCIARNAKWSWLSELLRVSIALVWLTAGAVSAGIYPLDLSVALVKETGVGSPTAVALVYLGAALDLIFGVATLILRRWRGLWLMQMVVIAVYTIIISLWLPEFWLHPFGPVVKNVPLIVGIYLMYELERG